MFLEDFICIAIIDFELLCVNKIPPPNLRRKEQQRRPRQNFENQLVAVLGESQTP